MVWIALGLRRALMEACSTEKLKALPVLSLYGSEDGVLNMERYAKALPLAARLLEHVIQGGNHAQFGNYGKTSKTTRSAARIARSFSSRHAESWQAPFLCGSLPLL